MKHKVSCLILGLVTLLACQEQKKENQNKVLKSNQNQVNYKIGNGSNRIWGVDPDLKPDRMHVDTKNGNPTKVVFTSDIDTAVFHIRLHDTINFQIEALGMEPAITQLVGVPRNVTFSKEYIKANRGKLRVEIPEVHELAKIMVAISDVGSIDSNMTQMNTPYHKEVVEYFQPYKEHDAIKLINENIPELYDEDGYWYYYALKMNACGYFFNAKNKITDDGIIHNMGFQSPKNPFIENKKVFEDFAETSNFRLFFKNHQSYYKELVETYKTLNPIGQMQQWLEDKFGFTYGSYVVYFSPLSGGAHSAQKFEDNGFKLSAMFVMPSRRNPKYSNAINEMKSSRVVFTEIDHNFVNPVSDTMVGEIDMAFQDLDKWVRRDKFNRNYKNRYAVFNEYMTWGVFSLYCMDFFTEDEVSEFLDIMENQMETSRGFIHFKEFNRQLMALYKENPAISMSQLYLEILEWSKKQ
ncbi:DUF4932 domain-containing protein [Flagellimonas meridianipacifica]|uniref:Uncharacterized protein DUF4932 n=1 Tax=Flagellimonas meridianipacifica TaxID=1080225 RepID=A0A2T0MHX1_9FLAO|nr:DUF4932 domain-containing protein [Allomuricauda pacifica]PRX57162.1 uncharacterized protein DUF4932 [Allomuricauda pacifica]